MRPDRTFPFGPSPDFVDECRELEAARIAVLDVVRSAAAADDPDRQIVADRAARAVSDLIERRWQALVTQYWPERKWARIFYTTYGAGCWETVYLVFDGEHAVRVVDSRLW